MNLTKIRKAREKLTTLRGRKANIKSRELISFAKSIGREFSPRGKEPTYVSTLLPYSMPFSIPNHGGRPLAKYTAGNILDSIERDLDELEARITKEKKHEKEED